MQTVCEGPRGSGSWEDRHPSHLQALGGVAQAESERESGDGGGVLATEKKLSALGPSVVRGTVAEPAVGVGIRRPSCVLRSDDGVKGDDSRRTEFICVGTKTCKNHPITNCWNVRTEEAGRPLPIMLRTQQRRP